MGNQAVSFGFLYGEPERVDGLCPECFNPALWEVTLSVVFLGGIRSYGPIQFCGDCDE